MLCKSCYSLRGRCLYIQLSDGSFPLINRIPSPSARRSSLCLISLKGTEYKVYFGIICNKPNTYNSQYCWQPSIGFTHLSFVYLLGKLKMIKYQFFKYLYAMYLQDLSHHNTSHFLFPCCSEQYIILYYLYLHLIFHPLVGNL